MRLGNDHSAIAPYEVLRAADGMVMIAAANGRLWKQLCAAVGASQLVEDPRFKTNTDRVANRAELKRELEARVCDRIPSTRSSSGCRQFGVACGRVRTVPEALEDPQVEPRQMLIPLDDPELRGFRVIGNPIKLSHSPPTLSRRPPRLGEHTREVLGES